MSKNGNTGNDSKNTHSKHINENIQNISTRYISSRSDSKVNNKIVFVRYKYIKKGNCTADQLRILVLTIFLYIISQNPKFTVRLKFTDPYAVSVLYLH